MGHGFHTVRRRLQSVAGVRRRWRIAELHARRGIAWRFAIRIEPDNAWLRRADRDQAAEPDHPERGLDRRRREPLQTCAAGGVRARRRRRARAPLSRATGGGLRVHAFRSAARTYVEAILPAFAEAYPDVMLNL